MGRNGPAEQGVQRQPGHVDAARDGQSQRSRNPGVHFEQRRVAGAVAPALDIGHVRQAGGTRDSAPELLYLGVVDRTAADRDAGIDPGPDPGHGGDDLAARVGQDVDGVFLYGQELLHDQGG